MFVAAAAVMFAGCEKSLDDSPVLKTHEGTPKVDFLNEPVMQNQYIDLTPDNQGAVFAMSCSQPVEYGFPTTILYTVQVSDTRDFTKYQSLLTKSTDCAAVNAVNGEVAEAICILKNIDYTNMPKGYFPIYMRLLAQAASNDRVPVPNTDYVSNVVEFKHVSISYVARWEGGTTVDLYLRGSWSEGWDAMPAYQFKTAEAKDTWITGTIELADGTNFKVSPSTWDGMFNNISFNGGSNDTPLKPDTNYALKVAGGTGNITLEAPGGFKGHAELTLKNGTYILKLVSE